MVGRSEPPSGSGHVLLVSEHEPGEQNVRDEPRSIGQRHRPVKKGDSRRVAQGALQTEGRRHTETNHAVDRYGVLNPQALAKLLWFVVWQGPRDGKRPHVASADRDVAPCTPRCGGHYHQRRCRCQGERHRRWDVQPPTRHHQAHRGRQDRDQRPLRRGRRAAAATSPVATSARQDPHERISPPGPAPTILARAPRRALPRSGEHGDAHPAASRLIVSVDVREGRGILLAWVLSLPAPPST